MPSYSVTKPLLNTSKPVVLLKLLCLHTFTNPRCYAKFKKRTLPSWSACVVSLKFWGFFIHTLLLFCFWTSVLKKEKKKHSRRRWTHTHSCPFSRAKLLDTDLRCCIKRSGEHKMFWTWEKRGSYLKTLLFSPAVWKYPCTLPWKGNQNMSRGTLLMMQQWQQEQKHTQSSQRTHTLPGASAWDHSH